MTTSFFSYVDSLLGLCLSEGEGWELTDGEFMSLCSEFLIAGTNTTATALKWIMAHLVMEEHLQRKLFDKIEEVAERRRRSATMTCIGCRTSRR